MKNKEALKIYDNSCKFRIYPNKQQKELIAKTFGCTRYVYNWALNYKKVLYETKKESISLFSLMNKLTELKKEVEFLNEVDSTSLQYAIKNLDKSYKNFFRKDKTTGFFGYPKFKSKNDNNQSYQTEIRKSGLKKNIRYSYKKSKLLIPKIGWIKCIFHKKILGDIKIVTISKNSNEEYYASIIVENIGKYPDCKEIKYETSVGIDLGIKDFAILSDGTKYKSNKFLRKSERRLAIIQRRLSRKKKGSNNYIKAKKKLASIHEKIKNRRLYYVNNTISDILKKGYDTICVEDLSVKNMIKNKRLSKSISDASFEYFKIKMKQKCKKYGINFIENPRFYPSSQICSCCGEQNKLIKNLKIRAWTCPVCHTYHDRDINAAMNLRSNGVKIALKTINKI